MTTVAPAPAQTAAEKATAKRRAIDAMTKKIRAERAAFISRPNHPALVIAVGNVQSFSDLMMPTGMRGTLKQYENMPLVLDTTLGIDEAVVRAFDPDNSKRPVPSAIPG